MWVINILMLLMGLLPGSAGYPAATEGGWQLWACVGVCTTPPPTIVVEPADRRAPGYQVCPGNTWGCVAAPGEGRGMATAARQR